MEFKNSYEGLDAYSVKVIRIKARSLIGKAGFRNDDIDDIRQELTLEILERMPKYDPAKGSWEATVNRIVDNRIARMIEEKRTAKRDCRIVLGSLNDTVKGVENEWIEQAQIVTEEDLPWNKGLPGISDFDLSNIHNDFRNLISKLPQQYQELFLKLMRDNIAEVSRETGIPRSTLYEYIGKIREYIEKSGLKNFF